MISGLDRRVFICRCTQRRHDPWRIGRLPRWFRNQWIIGFSVYRQTHENSVIASKLFRIPRRSFYPVLPSPSGGQWSAQSALAVVILNSSIVRGFNGNSSVILVIEII